MSERVENIIKKISETKLTKENTYMLMDMLHNDDLTAKERESLRKTMQVHMLVQAYTEYKEEES